MMGGGGQISKGANVLGGKMSRGICPIGANVLGGQISYEANICGNNCFFGGGGGQMSVGKCAEALARGQLSRYPIEQF